MANQLATLILTDKDTLGTAPLIGNTGGTTTSSGPLTLPVSVIPLTSVTGFPAASIFGPQNALVLSSTDGFQLITYTGISGSTLTGCFGGVGNVNNGAAVIGVGPRAAYSSSTGRTDFADTLQQAASVSGDYVYFPQRGARPTPACDSPSVDTPPWPVDRFAVSGPRPGAKPS